MATLLARPKQASPGVLVLTHKEIDFLRNGRRSPIGRYRFLYPIEILFARNVLRVLRRRYLIGAHIGFKLPASHDVFSGKYNDFLMSTPTLLNVIDGLKLPVFPKTSAFFIPEHFREYMSEQRSWDLIHISTNARYKNWDRFGRVAADLISKYPKIKILAISTHSSETSRKHLDDMLEKTMGKSYKSITYLSHISQVGGKGFPPNFIATLLGDSKVLALFSENEGSAKVVAEALAAGCLPTIYETLADSSAFYPERDLFEMTMVPGSESDAILNLMKIDSRTREKISRVSLDLRGLRVSEVELRDFLSELNAAKIDSTLEDDFRLTLPSQDMSGSPWLTGIRRSQKTADLSSIRDWHKFQKHCISLYLSALGE